METKHEIQRPEPKAVSTFFCAWEEAGDGALVGYYSSLEQAHEACRRHMQEVHECVEEARELEFEEVKSWSWRNGEAIQDAMCWRGGGYQIDPITEINIDLYTP